MMSGRDTPLYELPLIAMSGHQTQLNQKTIQYIIQKAVIYSIPTQVTVLHFHVVTNNYSQDGNPSASGKEDPELENDGSPSASGRRLGNLAWHLSYGWWLTSAAAEEDRFNWHLFEGFVLGC